MVLAEPWHAMVSALRLRPPLLQDETGGRLAHQELQEDGYAFFLDPQEDVEKRRYWIH